MFPSSKWEGIAGCPRQDYCSGLPRRVSATSSGSIRISLLSPAARSATRSLKAVSFSFTQLFIQGVVNADSAKLCKGRQHTGPRLLKVLLSGSLFN